MGDYPKALEYHNKALEIDKGLYDRVNMASDYYNLSFPIYKMNEILKALDHLTTGQGILTKLRNETGYSYPLLKDIEERIILIKKEQSD